MSVRLRWSTTPQQPWSRKGNRRYRTPPDQADESRVITQGGLRYRITTIVGHAQESSEGAACGDQFSEAPARTIKAACAKGAA